MAARTRPVDWQVPTSDLTAQCILSDPVFAAGPPITQVVVPLPHDLRWWTDAEIAGGIRAYDTAEGRITQVQAELQGRSDPYTAYRRASQMRREWHLGRSALVRERNRRASAPQRSSDSAAWRRMQEERLLRMSELFRDRLLPEDFPFAELPLCAAGGSALRVERAFPECRWPEPSPDVRSLAEARPYTERGIRLRFIIRSVTGRYFSRGLDMVFVDRSTLAERILARTAPGTR